MACSTIVRVLVFIRLLTLASVHRVQEGNNHCFQAMCVDSSAHIMV
jgi:hypothetical protein